jgi:hypothetical protein
MPALLTSASIELKRDSAVSTILATVAGSPMSPSTRATLSEAATSVDSLTFRELATTLNPRSINAFTIPAPIPCEAPVTMAVFCWPLMAAYLEASCLNLHLWLPAGHRGDDAAGDDERCEARRPPRSDGAIRQCARIPNRCIQRCHRPERRHALPGIPQVPASESRPCAVPARQARAARGGKEPDLARHRVPGASGRRLSHVRTVLARSRTHLRRRGSLIAATQLMPGAVRVGADRSDA